MSKKKKKLDISDEWFCFNCKSLDKKNFCSVYREIREPSNRTNCSSFDCIKNPITLQEYKEKNKAIETIEDYHFDISKIKQGLTSSIGVFNNKQDNEDHFYFGVKLTKDILKEKHGIEYKQQKKDLVIANDNFILYPATNRWQEEHNLFFSDLPIMDNKWSLDGLKNFKDGVCEVIEAKKLYEKIKKKYEDYVYFDDERFYEILPLWNLGTYFFILFEAYPYINLTGNKGTGKTKVMRVSELISFNGVCFVNPTPTTLFRFVECDKPTLHLDEAEKLIKDTKNKSDLDDTKELLNSGWQKGARVPRWEKSFSGKFELKNFDPYCPKMLASINGIKGALEDRSITCVMIKAKREDSKGDNWPDDQNNDFNDIRDLIYPFALKNWQNIKGLYENITKEFNLSNRDWQMWKPLICMAKLIDDTLYKKIGKYAEEITEFRDNEDLSEDSWDFKILSAVWDVIKFKEEANEKIELLVKGIKNNIDLTPEEKKKITHHYIGRFLNKNGFKKYRKRTGKLGVFYFISKNEILEIYKHHNYITLITQITPNNDFEEGKISVISEEKVV